MRNLIKNNNNIEFYVILIIDLLKLFFLILSNLSNSNSNRN